MYANILDSIIWQYTKINTSLLAIIDSSSTKELDFYKLHYGIYIESILSAVDHMKDCKYLTDSDIYSHISKSDFSYFRELRNSLVHRGFDICAESASSNGFNYYRTPQKIMKRNQEHVPPPEEPFIIFFLLKIDLCVRKIIDKKLKMLKILEFDNANIDDVYGEMEKFVMDYPNMSKEFKSMFINNAASIKASINLREMHETIISKYNKVVVFKETMSQIEDLLKNKNSEII